MAEKTVTVRLKAVIDQYQKAMKTAGDATASTAQKADAFKQLGQNTADLGDRLTRNVTLPIIGVGAAATKMSLDFDKTFVNMTSLAGVTGDEVGKMKDRVLELAGETGKAPQELAEALYFLRSSGLEGAQAMEALEFAAKGSAAGLGDTVAVADAVSSAMNAYAKSNLTAAEATDVMVATAREGKAEPAELAAQMGRLLPIASELGITFDDVGAGLAALSLKGGGAAGASTTLVNVMGKLLKPSQQAREKLDAVGIGLDDIRDMIAEGDLLSTLETLRRELGDNGFTEFLEDQQAIQGGLALTGGEVEKNRKIFAALDDTVGATDKAFENWAESMGAQNAQAWAKFQASMIRLGDTIAPLATDFITFASKVIEAFDSLPDPVKQATAALVLMAAAAGPLLSIGGRMITAWSTVGKLMSSVMTWASGGKEFADAMNRGSVASTGFAGGLTATAVGLGVVAPLAITAGAVLQSYSETKAEAKRVTDELVEALAREAEGMKGVVDENLNAKLVAGEMGTRLREAGADLDVFNTAIKDGGDAIEKLDDQTGFYRTNRKQLIDDLKESADAGNEFAGELLRLAESSEFGAARVVDLIERLDGLSDRYDEATEKQQNNTFATEELADQHEEVAGVFDEETRAVNAAVEALAAYADALAAQFDPLFGVLNASNGVRDARLGVEEATAALSEAEKEYGKDSAEAAAATRDLEDAHGSAVEAAYAFEQAQAELASAVENGDVKLNDAIGMLQRWVEQGYITQEEADITANKFRFSAGAVEGFSDAVRRVPGHTSTDVHVNTLAAREGISTVHGDLNRLDGRSATVNVYVRTHEELLSGYKRPGRAGGGPVYKGVAYDVGEQGREVFVPDQDGTIIPNHMLSKGGSMTSGWALSGGGVTHNHFDLSGAIISSERDVLRWLNQATAKAQRVRA